MDMILGLNVNFQYSFLNFSNIFCWYILELLHRGISNVYIQHMSFQYLSVSP